MFCPRCGHRVSDTANFCGGCGLPRAEIIKLTQPVAPAPQPEPANTDIDDLNSTISQLEGDLTGLDTLEDYTTDSTISTNKVENDFASSELRLELENSIENAPVHPAYESSYSAQNDYSYSQPGKADEDMEIIMTEEDFREEAVSTVDFIWMMIISGIPVIGFIYLIYIAFVQKENTTKSAWAKATLIICAFAFVLSLVFSMGVIATSIFW